MVRDWDALRGRNLPIVFVLGLLLLLAEVPTALLLRKRRNRCVCALVFRAWHGSSPLPELPSQADQPGTGT